MKELITSASAAHRLERARTWLASRPAAAPLLVVGATAEAAAEIVRTSGCGAVFGWERLTLGRCAVRLASAELTARGLSPLGPLGVEAVCARLLHALRGSLGKLDDIAGQPGLPRALARSLQELRLAAARPPAGILARLLEAYAAELHRSRFADRADVFRLAAAQREHALLGLPTLLLDLPVTAVLERAVIARLGGDVLATVPEGDDRTLRHLTEALGVKAARLRGARTGSLARVQEGLFVDSMGPPQALDEQVTVLSAPGESRECVELARVVLREAARGVPFDGMAILLRAPLQYRPVMEEALARAGIPAHFARGTVQPDPAGRALLALLKCAAEGLSARRFAEYLSLGEVPLATAQGAPPPPLPSGERWVPPDSDLVPLASEPLAPLEPVVGDPEGPVVAGSLRAPWRWERLLVEAAVIGGRERWERRLSGLAKDLALKLAAETEEGRRERLARSLEDLRILRAFALPLLTTLAALPAAATWAQWLEHLTALATQSLRDPARVLSLLAELTPMGPVGPVRLDEVCLVLSRRLTELAVPPPARRYGRVFVGPIEQARGLSFDVVLVPGLAEKLFPQKVLQDPLLRDRERAGIADLETSSDRVAAERLALRIAVGCASSRLVLSYPRLDLQQSRPRVPSFYGLEVLRAAEGRLPGFAELSRRAEDQGGARIRWPAPRLPSDAIDEAEHDLALLERAFHTPEAESRGTAHYLLAVNAHLARALRARARRWRRRWTNADGLVDPSPEALAALQAHALPARSWSPTALQNYASCPYRFFLQAVHRFAPREEPEAIDEIDPLSRGSLIHEVQFELLRELQEASLLPVTAASLEDARARLDRVLEGVASRYRDELAPAIDRVWQDGIAAVRADLREWLRRASLEPQWIPWRFELSFGLPDRGQRDPHSTVDPVALEQGFRLRGSIDLVERTAAGELRATDSKSGKVRAKEGGVIGGGKTLQPALYALALEKLFPASTVTAGRLYYCTFTGGFEAFVTPLDTITRESVRVVADTIGRAIARGFLPAAPDERECNYCDYRSVCGTHEEQRVKRKPDAELLPLVQLRRMP